MDQFQTGTISDASGYGVLAGIIISSEEQFLRRFKSSMGDVAKSVTAETLLQFLVDASRFSENTCAQLGEAIRSYSKHTDLQMSSTDTLSRAIRSRCFEPLDNLLLEYVDVLAKLEIDLRSVQHQLGGSFAEAVASRAQSAAPTQRFRLPVAGRTAGLIKILDYLQALQELPDRLYEYSANKLYGAEFDPATQDSFAQNIHDSVDELYGSCVAMIANLEVVRRKKWENHSAAESAVIDSVAMLASLKFTKRKSTGGALLAAVVASIPFAYVLYSGEMNLFLGGFAALSTLVAIFFFYRALATFAKSL